MKQDHVRRPVAEVGLSSASTSAPVRNHAGFIWSVADLLRGDYKRSEYGRVILPLTVLRRLDGVLAPTRQQVLKKHKQLRGRLEKMDNGQHLKRKVFYGRFGNGTRAIPDTSERERYKVQVWGP